MNKTVQLVLLTMLVISASFSQTPQAGTQRNVGVRGEGRVAEAIIAREEGFWDAWKNRRADFFKQNLTEESVVIVGTGRKGKSQVLEEISKADCLVRKYCLADFQDDLLRQECLPSNVPSPSAGDLWRERVARNSLCKLDLRYATGSVRTGVPSADPVCDVKKRGQLAHFAADLIRRRP
jgi:hypothetical protein